MIQTFTALLRHEARSPILWVALAAATITWPLTLNYSPLAGTLGSASARDVAYDVAFVAALLGALYADRRLSKTTWLLGRASAARGAALWLGLVGVGAALPAAMSLAPLAIAQGPGVLPGMLSMAFISFHMAALVLCFRSLGFSYAERSVGLAVLALALPAHTFHGAGPLNFLLRVLDPASGAGAGGANFLLTAHQIGSILALTLLARGLRPGPRGNI